MRWSWLHSDGCCRVFRKLLDIWAVMVRPTIELVEPRMRTGGIVIADNSIVRRDAYAELFRLLDRPDTRVLDDDVAV